MPQKQTKPRGGPVRRKRRSSEEIMTRVLSAATEEFERNGFSGATTAAIAANADVTEAQLFRCFSSKADLFHAAVFDPLSEHLQRFLAAQITDASDVKDVQDKSRLYISELQDFLAEHSDLWLSLLAAQRYARDDVESVSRIDGLQTYFERGAATQRTRIKGKPVVRPDLMVRVSFLSVLACVMFKDLIFPRGLATQSEIRDAINEFVMDGINANARPKRAS